jgi:competence protein ComEA
MVYFVRKMMMKKKYMMTGLTCIFILISGICYSCTNKGDNTSAELITDLNPGQSGVNKFDTKDVSNVEFNLEDTGTAKKEQEAVEDIKSGNLITNSISAEDTKMIYVHICGSVMKPGVYKVKSGSRVIELIELAGGLATDAAGDYINQAQQVTDGERIYIPNQSEVQELGLRDMINPASEAAVNQSESAKKVNINTADSNELMNLPGIGQAKANSIMEYREINGKFKTIEEIMKIPGIKEGLFNQISSYIMVQ